MMTKRAGDEEDSYYISGSWESLMQGYGETEWSKFKMLPITHFMEDFDRNYIAWEDYERTQR